MKGPTIRGFAVVLMAVGLVTALAGGGVLGPGAETAVETANPVGEADALAFTTAVVGATAVGIAAGYALNEFTSGADGDAVVAADANETYQEVHAQSELVGAKANNSATILNNTIRDGARTLAWTHGKAAWMKAVQANKSKAVARQWATENVSDYYATTQTNLVRQYNTSMKELKYLAGVHESHSDLDAAFEFKNDVDSTHNVYEADFTYTNITLVNGENVSYLRPLVGSIGGFGLETLSDSSEYASNYRLRTKANYNQSTVPLYGAEGQTPGDWVALNSEIEAQNATMSNNIEAWANQTYDSYEAGNVNMTDVVDPATLAQQFATDYNSTGHYAYAGADLAMMGVQTNLNNSFTIEVPSENRTLYGQLYTDWKPSATNGSLVTGHLYNVSKTDKIVYMATNDGLQAIGSDFRITSMTNTKTGEAVNSTDTESYNRQTSDVSLTAEQLQQLVDIRDSIQEREEAAAGGGGFNFGGLSADVAVPGLIIAAGGALFLLGRD